MLTGLVRGRCIAEVRAAIRAAETLFSTGHCASDLGDLAALSSVSAYPSRVRCALLPWRTLESALGGDGTPVCTENEH
jgi:nitrogen fixation NifU-like protein